MCSRSGIPIYKLILFVGLSVLDLALTLTLVYYGGGEENPIANIFLKHYGITGLFVFKLIDVFLVVVLVLLMGLFRKPKYANLIVWIACVSLMSVISYTMIVFVLMQML